MSGRAEADHEAIAETFDAPARVLRDLLIDDRLVRLHDLVRGGESPRREQARRLLDVREHDGHRPLGLADGKAADDRLRGQWRCCVDRLPEPFRDLAEQPLRRPVPSLALRIANRLQQPGLHRQPQLAPGGILADLDLCGVVGGFQLGALERLRKRPRKAKAQSAPGDDAFDHRVDPPGGPGRPGRAFCRADGWQHAGESARGGRQLSERGRGACHRGGGLERLSGVDVGLRAVERLRRGEHLGAARRGRGGVDDWCDRRRRPRGRVGCLWCRRFVRSLGRRRRRGGLQVGDRRPRRVDELAHLFLHLGRLRGWRPRRCGGPGRGLAWSVGAEWHHHHLADHVLALALARHERVLDDRHHAVGASRHVPRLDRVEQVLVDLHAVERRLVESRGYVPGRVVLEP